MIHIDIQKQFADFVLDIQANLPSHGITAIFGRSGAGKTSLINAVSGILTPDIGRIAIDDLVLFDAKAKRNLAIDKRQIGYVFQEARLFPHYKVEANLLYGSQLSANSDTFLEIVRLLDLEHLLKRMPLELSGGEKQRCAIARALLSEPKMLLMDEPLASLDLPRKQEIMPYLETLARRIKCPILYVSHSLDEIMHLADNLLLIEQGKVQAFDTLENIWQSGQLSAWQSSAEQSSLFVAELSQHHPQYALSRLALTPDIHIWMSKLAQPLHKQVRLRVFASDVSISLSHASDTSIRNILPATVERFDIHPDNPQGQVCVCLNLAATNFPKVLLTAQITRWAFDDLDLTVGKAVYAQIKSVTLTNDDTA